MDTVLQPVSLSVLPETGRKVFFETLRFLSLVSPGKAGMGVVQSGTDTGMLALRSRGHKGLDTRYKSVEKVWLHPVMPGKSVFVQSRGAVDGVCCD